MHEGALKVLLQPSARLVVQVAATDMRVVALCTDGTVWQCAMYAPRWEQLPPIPQPEPQP